MVQRKLVLFTDGFPFGKGEAFLESEIPFLAEAFDTIEIVSVNPADGVCRPLPANCTVHTFRLSWGWLKKAGSLRYLFYPLFWQEKRRIATEYKLPLSRKIVFTMLVSLARAKDLKKVAAAFLQGKEKVYYYAYWCDDSALALALLQARHPYVTAFARAHRWDLYFEASAIGYLPYRDFISGNLKSVFSISQDGKDYCRQVWKIENERRIQVARLGVCAQQRVGPGTGTFILVSCSSLIAVKRVHLILEALGEIKDISIRWVHFGDGPLARELETLANRLLPENVAFEFKGPVSNAGVLQWYKENNPSLFINVSASEGIPVSVMEAMSFGIPVVATGVGGTPEIVNAENGYLLEENPSAGAVAAAITRYYSLPAEEKEKKAAEAHRTWNEWYNAERNYKRFIGQFTAL